jgi:hypothetical protein
MNPVSRCVRRLWLRWKNVGVSLTIGNRPRIADVRRSVNAKRYSTKMLNKLTTEERLYLATVKSLPCGVCGAAGPSDAHHIEQHKQFLCIPLCKDCHQGSFNGIHGQQRIWKVYKKTEMSVLNDTIRKLMICK